MLNRILSRLMMRFMLVGVFSILALVAGMFGHKAKPVEASAGQGSNPWANGYVATKATPTPVPHRYASPYRYDSEAEKDEQFRRDMLHRLREASEASRAGGYGSRQGVNAPREGVNAPDHHEN